MESAVKVRVACFLWLQKSDSIKMPHRTHRASHKRQSALLFCACFSANLIAASQSLPSEPALAPRQTISSDRVRQFKILRLVSFLSPVESQTLEEAYYPITASQSVSWFITSTVGPPHLGGIAFLSACGTASNRPEEYGPHWDGFGKRFGVGMAGSSLGNAIEGSAGLVLREDPRYFRVPQEPFKARVGAVAWQTFSARRHDGGFEPAYARYGGIVGSNFISNAWRVQSKACLQGALFRSAGGFGGRMSANAFDEFWPDVKRYIVRKCDRVTRQNFEDAR